MSDIYANAVLKRGKIMFWYTGDKCEKVEDFYKDFMYAGLHMVKELQTGEYELVTEKVGISDEYGAIPKDVNKKAGEFYKQYELHENYKGSMPY